MKTSTSSTELKTASTGYESSTTTTETPAAPAEVETHDDLGYEIEETPAVPVVPEKPVVPHVVDEKIVEKPLTGYGEEEPEAPKEPGVPKTPEELTEEEKVKKDLTEVIKDLGEGYNKEKIAKFALDNKLTKEQVASYVKLVKEDDALAVQAAEEAKKAQRKQWKDELVKDPEFGGTNFDKNVQKVEKLLEKMPSTKKVLTEKGGMLPPYIMKDFLGLAKLLNPTAPLVTGDPAAPKEDDGNFLDDLYS